MDKNWKQLKADEMRMNPTPPEAFLWGMMEVVGGLEKGEGIETNEDFFMLDFFQFEFKRQEIVHGWIADFFFPEANLVIEVDGKYHNSSKRADDERDRILYEKYGISTLRFTGKKIYTRPIEVLDTISNKLLDAKIEDAPGGIRPMNWRDYDYLQSLPKEKSNTGRLRVVGAAI